MLEFSSLFDAHFHFFQCFSWENPQSFIKETGIRGACTCVHSRKEWEAQENLLLQKEFKDLNLIKAFGIHPQNPDMKEEEFLRKLLRDGEISAIGETGFDFFTEEFKGKKEEQVKAWNLQVELAAEYGLPLVVHVRKALDMIFASQKSLQNIKSILFHSFPGSILEANSILKKIPESYFSFGKQLLNGNKKAVSCVRELPLDRILLETDAPYQTLKGETYTSHKEIARVYEASFAIRPDLSCEQLEQNFNKLF